MRTTITIPDEVVSETLKVSGKKRLTEAVVASLRDYLALKKRLALLDLLFETPIPHKAASIKLKRQQKKWSS